MEKVGFIGAGKMASAIASGLIKNGIFETRCLAAADNNAGARSRFEGITGIACSADNASLVETSDVVVLAVKPQVAGAVLQPLQGMFAGKLLVSIAAGLPIDQLSRWIRSTRIVRVMPNTPAVVGRGASVMSCGNTATAADAAFVRSMLEAVGLVHELPEETMDAVTGLSGSGPAYVFEFIQALVDAGVAAGLEAGVSQDLVVQTVLGAATMVKRGQGTPDELRDAVTSPNGTTAAGLQVLRENGFRNLITRVVARAAERSVELGRSQNT